MGIIVSLGIAALREAIDGAFRTSRQVEQALRVKCLAVIPRLTAQAVPARAPEHPVARRPHPYAAAWRRPKEQADQNLTSEATCFAFAAPLKRRAVEDHLSVFTEAFRAIRVTPNRQAAIRATKVIGI